jgi:hypothetical protein
MSAVFEYLSPEAVASIVPKHARRLCLMASYEKQASVSDNVIRILQGLSPEFDAMVLLTNRREIGPADTERLPRTCKIQFVPNQLLDFGMWSRVLRGLHDGYDLRRICLVNDSCTAVGGFAHCFEKARMRRYKFWGLTENTEYAQHLQSFFLVAEDEAVPWMLEFFRRRDMNGYLGADKPTIIRDFEVGLSVHMGERFALNAIFPMTLMNAVFTKYTQRRVGAQPNYAYYRWDVLLAVGCPLLKRIRNRITDDDAAVVQALTEDTWHADRHLGATRRWVLVALILLLVAALLIAAACFRTLK